MEKMYIEHAQAMEMLQTKHENTVARLESDLSLMSEKQNKEVNNFLKLIQVMKSQSEN